MLLYPHNIATSLTSTTVMDSTSTINICHNNNASKSSNFHEFSNTFKNRHLSSGANSVAASSSTTSTMDDNNFGLADFDDELPDFNFTSNCYEPTINISSNVNQHTPLTNFGNNYSSNKRRWPIQSSRTCNLYYCVSANECPQQEIGLNFALNSHLQEIYRPSLLKQIYREENPSRINKVKLNYIF